MVNGQFLFLEYDSKYLDNIQNFKILQYQILEMDTAASNYLFVYGTLMSTFDTMYSRLLQNRSHYIGSAHVTGFLFDLGSYPGIIFDPETTSLVCGELYDLSPNQSILQELDRYEGISPKEEYNQYKRILIPVTYTKNTVPSWVYVLTQKPIQPIIIASGDYRLYIKNKKNLDML